MVKRAGRNTLREVEKATIEKLSNKIFRQFTLEMFMMIVPILVICLEWRQATRVEEDKNLLMWLVVYFGTMFLFSLVRLVRVPILQYSKGYFIYVCVSVVVYYIALLGIFVWGNTLVFRQLNDHERFGYDWQQEALYDHRILWIIMFMVLSLNWIAIILCIHFILFFMTLYVFWN